MGISHPLERVLYSPARTHGEGTVSGADARNDTVGVTWGVGGALGRKTKQGEEGMKSHSDLKHTTQGPRDSVRFHVHVCPEGAAPRRRAGGGGTGATAGGYQVPVWAMKIS